MTASTEWHGWQVGDDGYSVGYHPRRKSVALMHQNGSVLDVAAYFRSEAHAAAFLAWLDRLATTEPEHQCVWSGSGFISADARCQGCGKRYGYPSENGSSTPTQQEPVG